MSKQIALKKRPVMLLIVLLLLTGIIVVYRQSKTIELKPYHVITFNRGTADQFAIDFDGHIYLFYASSGGYVVKLDRNSNIMHEYWLNLEEIFPESFSGFRDRCFDSEGYLFMLNRKTRELIVMDNQGNFVQEVIVDYDFPQYHADDFRATQLNWLGADRTGVYFFCRMEEFGESVTYLVRVDLTTHDITAERFNGTGANPPDDALNDGSIYTFSTQSWGWSQDGRLTWPGTRLYINQFDFNSEKHERHYVTFLRQPGTYLLTYSEYDNAIYFFDLIAKANDQPVEIMKFCLKTSQLSGFTRVPDDPSLGAWNAIKAAGDKLYFLSNMREKVVIYQFQL